MYQFFAQCLHSVSTACVHASRCSLFGCTLGIFSILSTTAIATPAVIPINLEKQPLRSALNELAETANFDWGAAPVNSDYLDREIVASIKGYYTARQAVAELFKGTGIHYKWANNDGLLIVGEKVATIPPPPQPRPKAGEPVPRIEEITVIGSHIPGTGSAAPVFQYDRKDIGISGFSSTQEFINSLPRIFGGGAMEGAISPIKGKKAKFNIAGANGVNLHGMGYDATLVLVNGHRMAPVGFGDVVDISSIPLSAIEHIDIMTDGASAIYGSDAIGGVINIVLRKDYEGIETELGYGGVTASDSESYRFSHTIGKYWPSGNALLSYAYRERGRLSTKDRSFTQNATDPSDILGENIQHNAMFSCSQQLTKSAQIYLDTRYSTRKSEQNKALFGAGSNFVSSSVKQYTITAGGGIDIGDSWRINASALYSGSSAVSDTVTNGDPNRDNISTTFDIWSLDTMMDGDAFQTGGGAAKLALGWQFRREGFNFERETIFSHGDKSARNIAAVFAELFIPLTGSSNGMPGLQRLELTVAGRHEQYSDFDSSANPKVGLLWSPISGLNFRTTYSKSFRTPMLFELSESVVGRAATTLLLSDTQMPNDKIPTLLVTGYNADLQPETATNWTAGMDLTPAFWPNFRFSLTYFVIDFDDRIQTAFEGIELYDAWRDPRFETLVVHNPDIDLINFWATQPTFNNVAKVSPLSEIEVFIDSRLHNSAAVRERGLDFSLDYSLDTDAGALAFRLDGTYLLTLDSQVTSMAPFVNILNTPYNPVDLKLRNSVSWQWNGLTSTASVNYVGSYKDKRPERERDIDSWTTVDLNIHYKIKQSGNAWERGTTVSLSVSNLFDKPPPFVANELGYNFDATNANAFGRRMSLVISKQW